MPVIAPIFRAVRPPAAGAVDVVIVGAGAAGIAAARLCLAHGLAVTVLEARDRTGGRAVTAEFAGHPVDLGAHWLHAGRLNPLVRLGATRGERIRRSVRGGTLVIEGRRASEVERRAHARAFGAVENAVAAASRAPEDASIGAVFPALGRWREPARATFELLSGRPLREVSVHDYPSDEFGDNHFVRGGYGAYLARLAAGLPVALGTPALALDWSGPGVRVATARGEIRARAAICTLPVAVLAAGGLRFTPALPTTTADAIAGFRPGTYEHVVLNWPDAPFRAPDRLTKLVSRRASHGLLTRMDGAPFHYLELDHTAVAAARGARHALARLARRLLAEHFGPRALDRLRVLAVTDWLGDPFSRAAWAVAPPGHSSARDVLGEPIGERVWLAGEANSRAMWGTVGGAWEAGEGAANAVAALVAAGRVRRSG